MTVNYIGDPPAQYVIVVTKDCDTTFTLSRTDGSGNPLDWNASVYLEIDLSPTAPTTVAATVTNDAAAIYLDASLCNRVTAWTGWRAIMSTPSGATTLETPLIVGTFERHDGKPV